MILFHFKFLSENVSVELIFYEDLYIYIYIYICILLSILVAKFPNSTHSKIWNYFNEIFYLFIMIIIIICSRAQYIDWNRKILKTKSSQNLSWHELPFLGGSSYFPCLNKIEGLVSIHSVYFASHLQAKTCLVVCIAFLIYLLTNTLTEPSTTTLMLTQEDRKYVGLIKKISRLKRRLHYHLSGMKTGKIQGSDCKVKWIITEYLNHIYQPLHSGRIWHKVGF